MLGLHQEIKTHSELRVKLQNAAGAAWDEIYQDQPRSRESTEQFEEKFTPFKNLIEYDNNKFKTELLAAYNKMLNLFRDKL